MRILAIDDEPLIAEAIRRFLLRRGHTPLIATTGEEGIRMAVTENPDKILCDYELPDINGDEVYRLLPDDLQKRFYLFSGYPPKKFPVPDRVLEKFDSLEQIFLRMGVF